ncbi:MAG: AAA family ATPase [Cyanobacteria bacterium P01_A01_bin.123]
MVLITGYRSIETLYEGPRTMVLRGQPLNSASNQVIHSAVADLANNTVILKCLKADYPTLFELLCYRNHYTIAKALNLPGIVKPHRLIPHGHSYILVLEDFGGMPLAEYVETHTVSSEQKLRIALGLTEILGTLHQQRVIHKCLEPRHILIHPTTGEVKLTDFSIASLLPRETQILKSPGHLEGSLAYLSPEQTGRMNRGIDYRSDFYALGVTLYELFTGYLPFETQDPMALLHCHIAQSPIPPTQRNAAVPTGISAIILKLMAKMAEDRYQSEFGLHHDLQHCLQAYQANAQIPRFPLGTQDRCDRFQIPEKLYGRETEAVTLLAAFDRVANGNRSHPAEHGEAPSDQAELVLISGYSGIGKTALVNEVHKPIVRQRGYFIKGKFDQLRRSMPLFALIQAFQHLLRQLLTESSEALGQWQERILAVLGENAQVIVEVLPELEQIIGSQPPVPTLSPSAAQHRFVHLFGRFIRVFATAAHPLVIFLDDLQWADAASLNLIYHSFCETELPHLLVIGAYRDNEVGPGHPLALTLTDIRQKRAVTPIRLTPLDASSLNKLVADTLQCQRQRARPLTDLVMQKTQGNPFFATQFLKSLHEEGLITFDREAGYWQCDIAQIQPRSITPDVVEFMATRLRKLPPETQTVLSLAACMGNDFNLATLALIHGCDRHETAAQLWPALQWGLVLPTSEIYRFFQASEFDAAIPTDETLSSLPEEIASPESSDETTPTYRFLHDRVQQAAYSLIPENQRPQTHLRIGRLLWHNMSHPEEHIFATLNALNQGTALITDESEALAIAQLNLTGGQKAKVATAYDVASNYLQTALSLLPSGCWQSHYRLTLALHDAAAEVAYLRGDFSAMEPLIQTVLTQARSLLDCINVYEVRIQAHTARNQPLAAVAVALEVLRQLGVQLPLKPTKGHVLIALARTEWALLGKPMHRLVNWPAASDPTQLAVRQIMRSMSSSAYNAVPDLLPLLALKALEQSIYHGHSPDSAYAFAAYGVILCGLFENFERGYRFGQGALSLLERFNAQDQQAKILMAVHNFINHWKYPLEVGARELLGAYQVALENGDTEFATFNVYLHCYQSYCSGQSLTTLESDLRTYTQAVDQLNQVAISNLMRLYHQVVLNLMGHSDDPLYLQGERYDEAQALPQAQETNHRTTLFDIYFQKLVLNCLFGCYRQAVANGEQAKQYLGGAIATPSIPLFRFYDALARLGQLRSDSPAWKRSWKTQWIVSRHLAKLRRWAGYNPATLAHKVSLIEAERYRVRGRFAQALEAYDRAIAQAKIQGFLQEQALANELAAKCLLSYQKPHLAQVYLIQAYYDYARWGAQVKVEDLKAHYPDLLRPVLQTDFTSHTDNRSAALDLASVIKTSQALSQPLQRDQLLSVLMSVLLETAGAAWGAIVLNENNQLQVAAELEAVPPQQSSSQPLQIDPPFTPYPLDAGTDLPKTVLHYVQHTLHLLVVDDASTLDEADHLSDHISTQTDIYPCLPLTFQNDDYLLEYQPKSILCAPIHNQGRLIALVYLENADVIGAFNRQRLTVLQLLMAQAAISLRNAQLYEQLEDDSRNLATKVAERTQALEQEIRDRQAVEVDLRFSEETFSKAFHASPNPAVISRLEDGYVLEVNDSFCEVAGYSRGQVIGRTSAELNLWVALKDREQLVEQLQTQGGVRNQEFQFRNQAGEIRTVLLSAEMIKIKGTSCLLTAASDITQRKQIEETLKQAKETAEAVSRAKSDFLSRMSHELRTPLNSILGFTQLMAADPTTSAKHQEQLGIVERSSEHLLALITDTLMMSKIESGQIELDIKRCDLHHVLGNLKDMMQLKANGKGLGLRFEYDRLPRWIQTDEVKLRQILINLLSNAIKFTDQGTVTLRGLLPSTASTAKNAIQFEIEDTGPGIPEAELAGLFQPFYQTQLGRYTQEGSGLGLSICKSFVELLGGEISVRSQLHQGSCFRFHIQAVVLPDSNPALLGQAMTAVKGLAPDQPSYRILVAEDDAMSQVVMKRLLTGLGFQVKIAGNGEEAVALWQQWSPHLIWMDMGMPGLNGQAATQQIRKLEIKTAQPPLTNSITVVVGESVTDLKTTPGPIRTKIIALTANAFEEDRLAMLAAGCDDFVSKPFRRDVLLAKLAEHLGVRYCE